MTPLLGQSRYNDIRSRVCQSATGLYVCVGVLLGLELGLGLGLRLGLKVENGSPQCWLKVTCPHK